MLGLIAAIYRYAGKQELYLRQRPDELDKLVEIAKIQSTEASNAIEGIVTTNTRIKQLVEEKTTPKNKSRGRDSRLQGCAGGPSSIFIMASSKALSKLQSPVNISHVIGMYLMNQCYLCTNCIECRLNKRSRIQHPLFII